MEAIFQAKRRDWISLPKDQWWVTGDLIHEPYGTVIQYIAEENGQRIRRKVAVCPETVCRCTGRADRNKKRIFEGDIVKTSDGQLLAIVRFGEYQTPCRPDDLGGHIGFYLDFPQYPYSIRNDFLYWCNEGIEVIGNIWDDRQLLTATE